MSARREFPELADKPKRDDNSSGELDHPQTRVIGALVLIGLGIVFFLEQSNIITLDFNWWSFFILIPGAWMLWGAYAAYSQAGAWTKRARGQVAGGVMLLLVGGIFIFDLDWGKIWPLFLIVPGVLMLFGFMRGERD
jgi:hypothetical protein